MVETRGKLTYLFETLFRWIKVPVEPGLVEIGNPDENSPVFLTCNYDLTVRRVIKQLKGLDCYLLIAPTKGINVWCASCGDDFNEHSVISVIKITDINERVKYRVLIAPQLSAPGINIEKVREETGWKIRFGPVYAKDIPEYIKSGFKKTKEMRTVKFDAKNRLEMASVYFFTIALIFAPILAAITWFFPQLISVSPLWWILDMLGFCGIMVYSMYLVLPSMPIKSGVLRVTTGEVFFGTLIAVYAWIMNDQILNYIDFLLLSLVVSLILAIDFNGTTPIEKSGLGEFYYKRGAKEMKFITGSYKLGAYGNITMDEEKCIGCKLCIEVCPRAVYEFNNATNKAQLIHPELCVNCSACVKQCPVKCLEIKL